MQLYYQGTLSTSSPYSTSSLYDTTTASDGATLLDYYGSYQNPCSSVGTLLAADADALRQLSATNAGLGMATTTDVPCPVYAGSVGVDGTIPYAGNKVERLINDTAANNFYATAPISRVMAPVQAAELYRDGTTVAGHNLQVCARNCIMKSNILDNKQLNSVL